MSLRSSREDWLRFVIRASSTDRPVTRGVFGIAVDGSDGCCTINAFIRRARQRMRLQPKCAGEPNGIDTGLLPPCGFIVAAMDLTVVATAQWDGELIAHLAPERPKLRKPKMVSVRRLASADHARLPGDESNVVLVPNAS